MLAVTIESPPPPPLLFFIEFLSSRNQHLICKEPHVCRRLLSSLECVCVCVYVCVCACVSSGVISCATRMCSSSRARPREGLRRRAGRAGAGPSGSGSRQIQTQRKRTSMTGKASSGPSTRTPLTQYHGPSGTGILIHSSTRTHTLKTRFTRQILW